MKMQIIVKTGNLSITNIATINKGQASKLIRNVISYGVWDSTYRYKTARMGTRR
jgi:hypothetical protein